MRFPLLILVCLRLFDTQNKKDCQGIVSLYDTHMSKLFIPSSPFIVLFHATARAVTMCVSCSP